MHRTALAALALLTALAACGPTGSESATPSASLGPSVAASPSAIPSAGPSTAPTLGALTTAVVLVNDLNVRVAPSASAALLDVTGYPDVDASLQTGDRVLVLEGPQTADGFEWYAVGLELNPAYYPAVIPAGWIAAGTASEPWLEVDSSPCPEPTIEALRELSSVVRLGCYGSTPFTIDGYQAASPGGLGGLCLVEPSLPRWLMCDNINYNWVNTDGSTAWDFLLHFDPASAITPTDLAPMGTTGVRLRITGQFNDPVAEDCVTSDDPESAEALTQWLTCATRFVVEDLPPVS